MPLNRSEVTALLEVGSLTNVNSGELKEKLNHMNYFVDELTKCANGEYGCEFDPEATQLMLDAASKIRESIEIYSSVGNRVNDSCERLRSMLLDAQKQGQAGAESATAGAKTGSTSMSGIRGGVQK